MRLQDITSALRAFQAAKNQDTVSEEEFKARLAVCRNCPKNVHKGRTVRTRISEILGQYSNRLSVPDEITKRSCGVCGCAFSLLLPARKQLLHKDTPEQAEVRPDFCWMKTDRTE
jgi:hypothetical protein